MRNYETTIIIDSLQEQVKIDEVIKKYEDIILSSGKIIETEKWGKRRLAYPINKKPTGFYVHYRYSATPDLPEILEKDFLLNSKIMRFLTIATDKKAELQRIKDAANPPREERESSRNYRDDLSIDDVNLEN